MNRVIMFSQCACVQCLCGGDPEPRQPQPANCHSLLLIFFVINNVAIHNSRMIMNNLSSHSGISSADEETRTIQVGSALTWIASNSSQL